MSKTSDKTDAEKEVNEIFDYFAEEVTATIKSYEKTLPPPDAPEDVVDKYMSERDDYSIGSVVYYAMYREMLILHCLNVLYRTLQLTKPKGKSILYSRVELEKLRGELRALRNAEKKTRPVRDWYKRAKNHIEPTETVEGETQ